MDIQDTNSMIMEEKEDKARLRKEMLERQQLLRNQFTQKQKDFLNKSEDDASLLESEATKDACEFQELCVICLKSQSDISSPMGMTCYFQLDKLSSYYKGRSPQSELDQNNFSFIFTSCPHNMHLDCQSNAKAKISDSQGSFFKKDPYKLEFWCPGCRFLSNNMVPMFTSLVEREFYDSKSELGTGLKPEEIFKILMLNINKNNDPSCGISNLNNEFVRENLRNPFDNFASRIVILYTLSDPNEIEHREFDIVLYQSLKEISQFIFTNGHVGFFNRAIHTLRNNLFICLSLS